MNEKNSRRSEQNVIEFTHSKCQIVCMQQRLQEEKKKKFIERLVVCGSSSSTDQRQRKKNPIKLTDSQKITGSQPSQ